MKKPLILSNLLCLCVSASLAAVAPPVPPASQQPIAGDYVEARTASVFAGACHYNGELVTTGGEAIMAWQFNSGSWKNIDLSGLHAMAEVTSPENLKDESAPRKCEVVVDATASEAQAGAFADLLRSQYAAQVGQIVTVRRASIAFSHIGGAYVVKAEGFGSLSVQALPNNDCCSQPSLVWYTPLFHLDHRKVGYTESAAYTAGRVGDTWSRADENSAFYGAFTF